MGLHTESLVPEYWNQNCLKGPLHPMIFDHISLKRWQQIDRFLRISRPETPNPAVFEKLSELSEHLRQAFKLYWTPGTHLTVDESIQRFIGRSEAKVNIPSKPTPEGYKICVLAYGGYLLDWMSHAKGEKYGPVDLDEFWTDEEGFSKTQAVVLDLLWQEGVSNANQHIVWLDNLFTSARLLAVLRELGFGAAGTVRTTKTKRDELEETQGASAQKKPKKNSGLDTSLSDLKLKYGAQIEWGELYGVISKDGKVAQFGWKDQQVVLFMSTVHTCKEVVQRVRRRPVKPSTNAKPSRAPFGDSATKKLSIPDFIDTYNHFMNGVDVADQLRSYYDTQRVHNKTWKPLWHFLLDTAVTSSYKIANTTSDRPYAESRKHGAHKRFRMKLAAALFERSERLTKPCGDIRTRKVKELALFVRKAPRIEHGRRVKLQGPKRYCKPCEIESRVAPKTMIRIPLQELKNTSLIDNQRRQ